MESLVKVRKSAELLGKIETSEGRRAGDTRQRRRWAHFLYFSYTIISMMYLYMHEATWPLVISLSQKDMTRALFP